MEELQRIIIGMNNEKMILAMFIILFIKMIALTNIFYKVGIESWKAFIPIYQDIILYKIVGLSPWLIVLNLISAFIQYGGIIIIIINIIVGYKLGKSFNKSILFTIGLCLFPITFTLILGFSSSKYIKNKYKK